MDEGGVKAWGPHQVQNTLAFSDEEEEDLLDFMYKFKHLERRSSPWRYTVSGAAGWSVCLHRVLRPVGLGLLGMASLGIPSIS